MRYLSIVMLVCLAFGSAQARERIAAVPIDEAMYDESLIQFRAELLHAIEKRDVEWILSVAAEDIDLDIFIEGETKADFAKNLSEASYFDDMKQALLHGGYFRREEGGCEPFQIDSDVSTQTAFIAPYTAQFSGYMDCGYGSLEGADVGWNKDDYPGLLDVSFVTVREVKMRAEPDSSSEVLRLLSYELVNVNSQEAEESKEKQFVRVETWDHQIGYVGREFIRSYYDYSMALKKDNEGNWKIEWFGVQE